MYMIAVFARNRAENKTRSNSRRNPSAFCGQWEANSKPTSVPPDGTRLILLVSHYERCLGRSCLTRGVRLGSYADDYVVKGAPQVAYPSFTTTEQFIERRRDPLL